MESARSPVSNLPATDDPNADLCEQIRSDHEVANCQSVSNSFPWRISNEIIFCNFQLTFHIKNYIIDKSKLPKRIPSGVFIIEMIVDLDGATLAGTSIIVRIQGAPEDE